MENYRLHKAYIPKTRAEIISDTVEFSPKQFNRPQMYSKDATFHAAQDLIYALHNQTPESQLVKLGNGHKKALRTLAVIFRKSNPPAVPPRVPVKEVFQEKLQRVNQERTQMKIASQSKTFTNEEPLRMHIVESYSE